ncbi:MAG: DNA repair protein RecO [Alphaproteobacteria bacterium]|nr:DNA repair protein RecO [Alphaproteobacteria bacterium]
MQWEDEAILLSARRHGEGALVLQVFTPEHGRHGGLVRGGASRKNKSTFQIGNRLAVTWRARLPDQLGSITAELVAPNAALVLDDPARLGALTSACALIEQALPDRDPHPDLYNLLRQLIDTLTTSGVWALDYVRFELGLLADLGFGLDLSTCAVTGSGSDADLVYVSPRTGRAVSRAGAGEYADRLLPLPGFLLAEDRPAEVNEVLAGLKLAGYFLERHLFAALDRPVPEARQALVDRFSRVGT